MHANVMLRGFLSFVLGQGRRQPEMVRIEPQMPASFGSFFMLDSERAQVDTEVRVMRVFEAFFRAAEHQYRFKKSAMVERMQLMRDQDGWVTFKDAHTKAYATLDVKSDRVELMGSIWDGELMDEFRTGVSPLAAQAADDEARRDRIRNCSWYVRHQSPLEKLFGSHRTRNAAGTFTCSDMAPAIMEMLSDDASGEEIDELGAACGEKELGESIANCIDYDMHESQLEVFKAHPKFQAGVGLAATMLNDTSDIGRALAKIRLKEWAEELERTAFCPNTRAFGFAREEAEKLVAA